MYKELILGCGHRTEKNPIFPDAEELRMRLDGDKRCDYIVDRKLQNPFRVDINPDCEPDLVTDLSKENWSDIVMTSSHDELFDEVHAYEVLEHLGRQGDVRSFFGTFIDIWQCMRRGGFLFATCPAWSGEWAWGDPGHTRIITPGSLAFLSRKEYERQLGKTPMSDYRKELGPADFDIIISTIIGGHTHAFVLRAV